MYVWSYCGGADQESGRKTKWGPRGCHTTRTADVGTDDTHHPICQWVGGQLFLLMSSFSEWLCVRMLLQKSNRKKLKLKTTHLHTNQSNQTFTHQSIQSIFFTAFPRKGMEASDQYFHPSNMWTNVNRPLMCMVPQWVHKYDRTVPTLKV